jgi:hypothetical protein
MSDAAAERRVSALGVRRVMAIGCCAAAVALAIGGVRYSPRAPVREPSEFQAIQGELESISSGASGGAIDSGTNTMYQPSRIAAQQRPIDTTACEILAHPSAFNNKMVRIHGDYSGNFEYSALNDGCSQSMWFAYANGGGPPGLLAYVSGGAREGDEDADGRYVLPVPVKLVKDANFRRFEKLMRARAEADARSDKEDAKNYVDHRVSATFVGRVDGVADDVHAFHLKRGEQSRADFLGFGMMGMFDARFVMQSVEGDAVLKTDGPIAAAQGGAK